MLGAVLRAEGEAGAVAGKIEEAEGRVIGVEEVSGVTGIPVEVVVRDEAAEIPEAGRLHASMAHGYIAVPRASIIIARLNRSGRQFFLVPVTGTVSLPESPFLNLPS